MLHHRLRRCHLIGRGHEREPLADYALFITTFLTVTSRALFSQKSTHANASQRFLLSDAILLGLATARLSRLVTREKIMRVVRAPFTEVEEGTSLDEVKERPRGDGFVRAMGELLTCPRCFGMWVSAGLNIAYRYTPSWTRTTSGILAVALINDFVHQRFAHSTTHPHTVENKMSSSSHFHE